MTRIDDRHESARFLWLFRITFIVGHHAATNPNERTNRIALTTSDVRAFRMKSDTDHVVATRDYALRPSLPQRFRRDRAEEIVKRILEDRLRDVQYHADHVSTLTRDISDEIRREIASQWPRYKFLVQTWIAERRQDIGIAIASRAVWDAACDALCDVTFRHSHLHGIVAVFAIYLY